MSKNIGPEQQRFNAIMNKRLEITPQHVGSPVRCKVQGNPTTIFDERIPSLIPGQPAGALKDLYSLNVSKSTVLDSAWFTQEHAKAVALEASGDAAAARKLFDELMNASQLSIGIINRDGMANTFAKDQMVDVTIGMADVKDKNTGEVRKSLVATGITPVAAVVITARKRFGADVEEPAQPTVATTPAATVAEIAQP